MYACHVTYQNRKSRKYRNCQGFLHGSAEKPTAAKTLLQKSSALVNVKMRVSHLEPEKSLFYLRESQRAHVLDIFQKSNYQNWSSRRFYINF